MKNLFRGINKGPELELQKLFLVFLQKKLFSLKSQRANRLNAELLQKVKTCLSTINYSNLKTYTTLLVYLRNQIKPDYKYLQSITNVWGEF